MNVFVMGKCSIRVLSVYQLVKARVLLPQRLLVGMAVALFHPCNNCTDIQFYISVHTYSDETTSTMMLLLSNAIVENVNKKMKQIKMMRQERTREGFSTNIYIRWKDQTGRKIYVYTHKYTRHLVNS